MSSVVSPVDQENVNGAVPLLTDKSTKAESPGQFKSVFCKSKRIAGGSVKVSEIVAVQPFASVVKTV